MYTQKSRFRDQHSHVLQVLAEQSFPEKSNKWVKFNKQMAFLEEKVPLADRRPGGMDSAIDGSFAPKKVLTSASTVASSQGYVELYWNPNQSRISLCLGI